MRLLSIGALYVLWGSLSTPGQLVEQYFAAKGERTLLDKRRRLSDQEADRVDLIRLRAEQAVSYRDWAREAGGQPVLRDAIVANCVAFESALKGLAVAFRLAELNGGEASRQFFVQVKEHKRVVAAVIAAWNRLNTKEDSSRAATFFDAEVFHRNPAPKRWQLRSTSDSVASPYCPSSADQWSVVSEAFRLRNAIVHSDSKPSQRIEIGSEAFHPGEEACLTFETLTTVQAAFRSILNPFNPEQF